MRRALLGGLLALAPTTATATEVSVQETLLRAKPAVVLVLSEVASEVRLTCSGRGDVVVTPPPFRETGTGWFINPDGWVITNAHVVSPAFRPSEHLRTEAQKAARPGCRVTDVKLESSVSVILSNGFRLAATVAKYSPPVADDAVSGQDLALLQLEAADMPALALGDSDALKIGDRLYILGFPNVVLTHELLNASAKVEATVTSGAVSGLRQDRASQPLIQTDASAAWGTSGGPAIDEAGRVVGVLTFITPGPREQGEIVQGFNFVIPSQAVQRFLGGTGVALDEPSRFNEAWQAALRDFFAGHHRRAEKAFTEANRLLPELPDVKRLGAENDQRIKTPPPTPFPWAMVAAGLTAVSLGAYGGLLGMRWKRNRFRIRPSEVMRLLETSPVPPVILDVREDAMYARSPVRIPNSLHVTPLALESGSARLPVEPGRALVAYCT